MELSEDTGWLASVPFMVVCVCSIIAVILGNALFLTPDLIDGIYAQPGQWYFLKRTFIYFSILLRKWRSKQSYKGRAGAGYGQLSTEVAEDLEFVTEVADKSHAFNSVYTFGVSATGEWLVARIGLRPNGERSCWFVLGLPGIGDLVHAQYPDCVVQGDLSSGFKAGGLTMEVVEPMKLWRISYNGLCKAGFQENIKSTDERPLIHVRCSFMWSAFTPIFNFDTDLNSWHNSGNVAKEPWNREFFKKLRGMHQTHYEQYGMLRGVVKVEGHDERTLVMRGIRDHSYGVRDWAAFYRYALHFGVLEDGSSFQVGVFSIPGYLSHLSIGYLFMPNGVKYALTSTDISLPKLLCGNQPPDKYSFTFSIEDGRKLWVKVEVESSPVFYMGSNWEVKVHERKAKFTVSGVRGWGISEFLYRNDGGRPSHFHQEKVPLVIEPDPSQEALNQFVLPFTNPACQSTKLVGGKGAQLAILTHLRNQLMPKFEVPPGFCVTSNAFQVQLKSCPKLQEAVKGLCEVSTDLRCASLEDTCNWVGELFSNTPVCAEISSDIKKELERLFGKDNTKRMFAVRSSAIGEDTAEMSAAGQLTTILGVKGYDKVCKAVQGCWASLFSFQAVQYRRQRGQSVESTMGVVVMEMVPSEISGVLFSRDPVDGNPAVVLINANYGLGESVVSGVADPDTITLRRKRKDKFEIAKIQVGSKKKAIMLEESGGTLTKDLPDMDSQKACISNEVAFDLARLSNKLEERFGDPRDIEWAYSNGAIYLLQARPITTIDMMTDYELLHEFDSGIATDREWLTTCNIQEMMPGAVTPLTYSVFVSAIDWCLQKFLTGFGGPPSVWPCLKSVATSCGKIFISLTKVGACHEDYTAGVRKDMMEIALLGQLLEDFTTADIHSYHGPPNHLIHRIWNCFKMIRVVLNAKKDVEKLEKKLNSFRIKECRTAAGLYQEIDSKIPDLYEAWRASLFLSSASSSYSNVLMAVLTKGSAKWETIHYSEVAMLLSTCPNVPSADVPMALENIVKAVMNEGKSEAFVNWEPSKALQWLQGTESKSAGKIFRKFLQEQGHRCIRESEFREASWKMQPVKVIPVIQSILKGGNIARSKKELSVDDAVKQLKSPVTFFERMILKIFIPKARVAVGHREWGKSLAVKMHNHLKEGYWRLAQLMVEEGRLPESDLIFFLTHHEIGLLLKNRSPLILSKAIRRRKLLPVQMAMNYPEVFRGSPQPIETQRKTTALVTLKGLPVCQGCVEGTARVVTRLEDAGTIQSGDILIVIFTDVGWSPYFPLIGGLVTELGGLISHGAVVAREYGIPCIVNAKGATTSFQSGDHVVLDGTKGTIQKISSA
nr:uncharacterized protein LOC129254092 [Lytechinus pictus]